MLALLLLAATSLRAQTPPQPTGNQEAAAVAPVRAGGAARRRNDPGERQRLQRLATRAVVWAKLELSHPVPQARRDVDWDRAFTRAVPRVEAARTTQDLVRALNEELFAVLDDPLSFARTQEMADERDSSDVPGVGLVRRLAPGVAYLDARDPATLDVRHARAAQVALRADSAVHGAPELLVVDLRWQRKEEHDPSAWLGLWTAEALPTGVLVSRLHRGHSTPTRWQVEPAGLLAPPAPRDSVTPIRLPTVFLVNLPAYAALQRGLDALQRRPGVAVALERSGPLVESWDVLTFPGGVRVSLQSPMLVSRDGALGARADTVLEAPVRGLALGDLARATLGAARARAPRPAFAFPWRPLPQYPVDTAPLSRELRILGLVRLWKEVGAFSGYLPYASVDWASVPREWIPAVEAATTTRDYYRTLQRLVARLNDTHASVHHPTVPLPPRWTIPAWLRRSGDRVLVVRVDSTQRTGGLSIGDEVLALDGVPVRVLEDSLNRYRSASSRATLARNAWEIGEVVRGDRGSEVRLTVTGPRGRRDVVLRRTAEQRVMDRDMSDSLARRAGLVRRLPGNIGYVDLYRMTTAAGLDSALTALASTDALVLDARSGTPAWTDADIRAQLVSRFFREPVVEPLGGIPTTFMHGGPPVWAREEQPVTRVPYRSDRGVRYLKPLAVLVGVRDQSYGESAVWLFRFGHRATLVGEPTAGTNGGAPDFSLPGGGYAVFTHQRITNPDGNRFHGIGLVPDVIVRPTPQGLRAGRDEVLDRAVGVLRRPATARARGSAGAPSPAPDPRPRSAPPP